MLTETLSRFWYLIEIIQSNKINDYYYCFSLGWEYENLEVLYPRIKFLLNAFGVKSDRIIVCAENGFYGNFIIPSQGYKLFSTCAVDIVSVYQTFSKMCISSFSGDHDNMVYLSRSRFKGARKLLNEICVERLFEERGFKVVHPESLPIEQQIAIVAQATHVAGCYGSQMHLSFFMREGAKKLVICNLHTLQVDEALISKITKSNLFIYFSQSAVFESAERNDSAWTLPNLASLDNAISNFISC